MNQKAFAERAVEVLKKDESDLGLAVGGSWLTAEIDEFSDLDLILVTKHKVTDDKALMLDYAKRLGQLLSGFTGEHVGEPRLLICLYDDPLLHVDIKFLTLEEFHQRVETPVVLLDKEGLLKTVLEQTESKFPYPDYQWIEDRFWTWVHYALLKIGRGEYTEALDFFGFLRMVVLGPLLHIKNGHLPKGVRKVEMQLRPEDFGKLQATIPTYAKASLITSLQNAVALYRELRGELFPADVALQKEAEERVMEYLEEIKMLTKSYPAVQFRIARPTSRLPEVVRFYTEGLQLKVLSSFDAHEGYNGVMIGLPDVQYHLEFTQDAKQTGCLAPTKDNLLVFYFQTIEELNNIRKSLGNSGYQPESPENPYWQDKSWTYEDPDGWRVVLYNGTFMI